MYIMYQHRVYELYLFMQNIIITKTCLICFSRVYIIMLYVEGCFMGFVYFRKPLEGAATIEEEVSGGLWLYGGI